MIDPKDVESVINKSDMILDILKKRNDIEFKLGMVRIKVAFLGYEYIWGEMDRDTLTAELLALGFDNLTLTQIIESIVHLERKLLEWKTNPKRETDPVKLAAMRNRVENNIRKNVFRGKF